MSKNVKASKFLIADGNPTLLAWGLSSVQQKIFINNNLGKVDQIGFVEKNTLEMMGQELCINAALAFASTLNRKGILNLIPFNISIPYLNAKQYTSINFPLSYKKSDNIILLDGIGFKFENINYQIKKSELKALASVYTLPAFGIVLYEDNKIFPYIYVKATDSLKQESACGSGSIATSLFTGFKNIIQPTGKVIRVNINGFNTKITSEVKEVVIE